MDDTGRTDDPAGVAAVAKALGSPLVGTHPVGWGDAAATVRLELADGRSVAARRGSGPEAAVALERIAQVMRGLAAAGLPVPHATAIQVAGTVHLVTPWVDGLTGAAWLDDPDRAIHLAEVMGGLVRRLGSVDPSIVSPDAEPAGSRALARQSMARLDRVRAEMDEVTGRAIESAITWLGAADRWRPVVVHGDFAPVNVIVGPDGDLRALLDFEHVRLGSPSADVAWWGWVVRHHHPAAFHAAWPTFRAAAGVPVDVHADLELRASILVRLVEAVAAADDLTSRARWARRLDEAATWEWVQST